MVQKSIQKLLKISSVLLFTSAHAFVLYSPFPSQIAEETGIKIPNARFVNGNKKVLRSMRPWTEDPANPGDMSVNSEMVDQIINAKVTDLLIFKTPEPDRDDITLQRDAFTQKGFATDKIKSIAFPWKGFTEFKEVCRMSLQALRLLKEVKDDPERKILFHCTVGEDRTGYLAALFALLEEPNLRAHPDRVKEIFKEEACRGGYEGGNKNKPRPVRESIRQALTPLFTKMAFKIQRGYISWDKLSDDQCNIDPGNFESYDYDTRFDPGSYTCETSPDFPDVE